MLDRGFPGDQWQLYHYSTYPKIEFFSGMVLFRTYLPSPLFRTAPLIKYRCAAAFDNTPVGITLEIFLVV
jgi:hypothetical protein